MLAAAAAAALSLLLAAAPAGAAVRSGQAPAGRLRPAAASTRIAGGVVGYDPASGRLDTTVRMAAPTGMKETPAIGVVVRVGTWSEGSCRAAPGSPIGQVSGLPDTFGYPTHPDPSSFYLTQVKLAALGADVLDGGAVTAQLSGESVVLNAVTPLFAGKSWNCASFEVSDQSDGASERGFPTFDETAPFALAAPGAGVRAAAGTLVVRGGRVALRLRNEAAAARGSVTLRVGRTVLARGRFSAPMLARARAHATLTAAGRALLRRRPRVAVAVTVAAAGAQATTTRATLRR